MALTAAPIACKSTTAKRQAFASLQTPLAR
jgi:hypothetical protein